MLSTLKLRVFRCRPERTRHPAFVDVRRVELVLAQIGVPGRDSLARGRNRRHAWRSFAALVSTVTVFSVAACGSDDANDSSSSGSSASAEVDVDGAKEAIAPFIGQPS